MLALTLLDGILTFIAMGSGMFYEANPIFSKLFNGIHYYIYIPLVILLFFVGTIIVLKINESICDKQKKVCNFLVNFFVYGRLAALLYIVPQNYLLLIR